MSEPTYNLRWDDKQHDGLTVAQIHAKWAAGEIPDTAEIWQSWTPEDLRWVAIWAAMALPPRAAAAPAPAPAPAKIEAPARLSNAKAAYDYQVSQRLREGWTLAAERPDGAQLTRKKPRGAAGPWLIFILGSIALAAVQEHRDQPLVWVLDLITFAALVIGVMRLFRKTQETVWVPRT